MKKLKFLVGAGAILASSVCRALPAEYLKDLENFQQSNIQMAVQKGKLDAASDNHLSKKLFWTPTLSLSAAKTRDEVKNSPAVEQDYWLATANLNLFKGGADWASLTQADAAEKAQALAVKNEELKTDVNASDLIFKSIYIRESLRIQNEIFKLKEEALKILRERYSAGRIPLQEVVKSEVDLSQQQNRLRLAKLSVSENDASVKAAFVDSVQSQSWPFSDQKSWSFQNEAATEKLPSVEQKYWNLKSSEYSWRGTSRTYWPTIDVSAQYEETPIKDATTKELISTLTLTIPLWSRYETASQVSSAYSGYLAAEADFKAAEKAAKLRREFLAEKVESVRVNVVESKKNLEKSKQLYNDMLRAFRLGKLSVNDLFIEQERLLASESSQLDAQLSFHQTLVESCVLEGLRVEACVKE